MARRKGLNDLGDIDLMEQLNDSKEQLFNELDKDGSGDVELVELVEFLQRGKRYRGLEPKDPI